MLAWALWTLAMVALAAVPLLDRLLRRAGRPDLSQWSAQSGVCAVLGLVSAATTGAVVASRRPSNPVGWLLLAYGLLTVLLGLGYAAVVLGLGRLLPEGSSLVVAAAFQPLPRRVQALVDRRFNRRRYDAAQTIAAFSARLRDEVGLRTLSGELLAVVDQAMQPTQASLWLRPRG